MVVKSLVWSVEVELVELVWSWESVWDAWDSGGLVRGWWWF